MQKQAEKFGAEIVFDDVVSVDFGDGSDKTALKTVTCDQGDVYQAHAIVVTTGSDVRKLGVPGEKEYSGNGVSYCATCDGFFFRGKPIVVIGGGDSAFTDAEFLTRFGSSVTLIHRREEFRAAKIMVDRAKANDKMSFMLDSVVDAINGEDGSAQSVTVRNVKTGETAEVPAAGVFVAIGNTPTTEFLNGALKLDEMGYIKVDGASTRTSLPGVFAAGDVVDSVYRQAVSAAGMGCRAALDAQDYLDSLQ
jgi:thioredoxin reductase (NADPH)